MLGDTGRSLTSLCKNTPCPSQHRCCEGAASCGSGWHKHRRCLKLFWGPGGPQNQNWVSGRTCLAVQLVLTKGQSFIYLTVSSY